MTACKEVLVKENLDTACCQMVESKVTMESELEINIEAFLVATVLNSDQVEEVKPI